MSSRDNFRQAARELFGLESKKGKDGDAPASVEDFLSELPPDEPMLDTQPVVAEPYAGYTPAPPPVADEGEIAREREYSPQGSTSQVYSAVPSGPPYAHAQPAYGHPSAQDNQDYAIVDMRRETSIIAKGTTIVGRVRTDGHIEVMGKVEGNIDAEGNIAVSGRVTGNIKGNHLELLSCQLKGNLNANAGVFVNSETVLIGDVTAENVIIDGRIKGNIEAAQSAEFNRNSYIVGDITAKSIAIEPGAVVNGMLRTLGDQFGDEDFDDFSKF